MTTPAVTGGAASRRRENAAARLYVEYRERIYRFCYTRLRSREEAEDAVQNVFMRVHMALDKGVVPEFEAAWLYKIAHNVCLSRVDSNARRGAEELHAFDDDDIQVAAPEVDGQELAGLSEALEGMPHNLRTAILLREWQGLSYAEIAAAMGLSVSAVETLIFRARRHLAWALEHPGEKPKSAARRLLDLLGLGWLRNVLVGAGPAAKLAAGAALLALGGGGAAVAFTDAHARPAPPSSVPVFVPVGAVARVPSASKPHVAATRVADTAGVRHRTKAAPVVAAHAPRATRALATPTPATPATTGAAAAAPPAARAPTPAAAPAPKTKTATPVASVPTPTVSTPTPPAASVPVPTVSVPTAGDQAPSVPSVTVPTASVPTVSVPAVSLPVGGAVVSR